MPELHHHHRNALNAHYSANNSQRTHAFTLPEVLVVVSIMGVLVGILLPTVKMIKEHAVATKCQSNMRQIAAAMQTSSADQEGLFPILTFTLATGAECTWPHLLFNAGLLDAPMVASCPGWKETFLPINTRQYNAFGIRTYAGGENKSLNYSVPSPASYTSDFQKFFRFFSIRNSASYPMMTDTCGTDPAAPFSFEKQFTEWSIGTGCAGIKEGLIHFRHNNHSNMLYGDSHVESIDGNRIIQTITNEYDNKLLDLWGVDQNGKAIHLN